ncbi:MAG: hypothetical protein OXH68_21095 [Gammaproteobacteria bacterium]|nr:hypothetical protein [Gammaproteobacteria bacterium]
MNYFERASVNPTYAVRGLGDQPVGMPTPSPVPPSAGSATHTSHMAIIERLLEGPSLDRTFAVFLLIAMAISPFLNGVLVGLAIIGAGGAVRTLLGT